MAKITDLTGKRFGLWTVVQFSRFGEFAPVPPSRAGKGKRGDRRAYWLCRCECGTEKEVIRQLLVSGKSTRCRACYAKAAHQGGQFAEHLDRVAKRWQERTEKRCAVCGVLYQGTAKQLYCSGQCKKKNAEKRKAIGNTN